MSYLIVTISGQKGVPFVETPGTYANLVITLPFDLVLPN